MPRVRVRQHVNPLSIAYQTPVSQPDWHQIYQNLEKPLHLDIGCGWGRFLQEIAQQEPDWNYLGLEIREPLVDLALKTRDELGLQNLHYIFCNANNSLQPLLSSLPAGVLQRVSIQFPDPWFKKRHQKRRVVKPELVMELAEYLVKDGIVFLQSDVEPVAAQMRSMFAANHHFRQVHETEWLGENIFPVPTEREMATLEAGKPVYRAMFVKM